MKAERRTPARSISSQRRTWLKLYVIVGSLIAMLLMIARPSNAQGPQLPQPTIIPKEDEQYYETSNTGEVRRIPDSLEHSMKMTDEQGRIIYFVPSKVGTGKVGRSPTVPLIPATPPITSPTVPVLFATSSISSGVVRGVVTSSNRQPIFEAGIGCSPLSPGVAGDAMVIGPDEQGRYEKHLEPGRYLVAVHADHYASQEKEIEVRADQVVQLDFKLTPD